MDTPGFLAESSLCPTMGRYRATALFGRAGRIEVLPMQEIPGLFHVPSESGLGVLGSTALRRTITCCRRVTGPFGTHPLCRTYNVPFFETCRCLAGFPVCTPPVIQNI